MFLKEKNFFYFMIELNSLNAEADLAKNSKRATGKMASELNQESLKESLNK